MWVGYGDRTVDEMAHAWVNVTYMNDTDYRAAIEERRKALPTATTTLAAAVTIAHNAHQPSCRRDHHGRGGFRYRPSTASNRRGRTFRRACSLEPLGTAGEAIYPAFEGWGPLKDGSNTLLLGYFNRNKTKRSTCRSVPTTGIEPGGPDFGQPTHFLSGRQWGMFAITVPKDFGTKKLTWTMTANGHTTVGARSGPTRRYWIDFYKNGANGNEPPRIKFAPDGTRV